MELFQMKSRVEGQERLYEFLSNSFVAIGRNGTGSLKGASKDEIREKLATLGYKDQSLKTNLGTVNSFINVMQAGDAVLLKDLDYVHIGILQNYEWQTNYMKIDCAHMRPVEWVGKVRKVELNDKVQALLRNGPSVTKFQFPFEESGLKRYIKKQVNENDNGSNTSSSINGLEKNYEDITDKALSTLENLLGSKNENIKLEAAKELIQFVKK